MTRHRRELLLGVTAAAATAGSLPAPSIAQGIRELKMVTDWPENTVGLQTSAERLARSITAHLIEPIHRLKSMLEPKVYQQV